MRTALAFFVSLAISSVSVAQSVKTGAEIYQNACQACHGADGKGSPRSQVGFDVPLPDFSSCGFTTAEPIPEWIAIVHLGGRTRALDQAMPAFGEALSAEEIERVVAYLRGFCASKAWPDGDLNLPRPFATAKAFPENEAVFTFDMPTRDVDRVHMNFEYEGRLGPRSQYEVVVPLNAVKLGGIWSSGLGDIGFGFKHAVYHNTSRGSIVSGAAEMTFPTGEGALGLGDRLLKFEWYGTFSQRLRFDAFLHAQAGMEVPLNLQAALNEVFWRVAAGKTFTQARWGRAWSPIVEVLGAREIEFGEPVKWDLIPQLLVTLSRRQHVMASGGVRLPITIRTRSPAVVVALLWEWTQGSVFSGW
jgi:mono/diheme cytochrome c family protein